MEKTTPLRNLFLLSFFVLILIPLATSANFIVSSLELISVNSTGNGGNSYTLSYGFSADSRYALLDSLASDLVSGDTNSDYDVFLRDLSTGTTTKISQASDGSALNATSGNPSMSDNARYIAYVTAASNAVTGDANGKNDIILYDRTTGANTLVSRATGAAGAQATDDSDRTSISDDGNLVTFETAAMGLDPVDMFLPERDIFLRNISANTTLLLSETAAGLLGNGNSYNARIAGDGGYVVFESDASNLVSGDTNGVRDIFIKKTSAGGSIFLASQKSAGGMTNGSSDNASISDDGRYVAYMSAANNIVSDDDNGDYDVFLYDFTSGSTILISRASGTGIVGNSNSWSPEVSEDGTVVTFISAATNLVSGDTNGKDDVFVYKIATQELTRVDVTASGTQSNDSVSYARPNTDGSKVMFYTKASNLVSQTTSGLGDVFLVNLEEVLPNLQVSSVSYNEALDKVDYTIQNSGEGNVGADAVPISSVTLTDPDGTVHTEESFTWAYTEDFYPAGASGSANHPLEDLNLQEGTSQITVCVDFINNVTESDETDNCTSTEVTLSNGVVVPADSGSGDSSGSTATNSSDLADAPDADLTCDSPFTDTVGHWAEKTICLLYEAGTVSGKSEGIFDPDNSVTRAEMLKMVLLNSGQTIPLSFDSSAFSDVNEEDWYFGYVMDALDLGVVEGYSDGTFKPNDPVNRAEALTMILRMANLADQSSTSGLNFSDLTSTDWFYDEVGLGIDNGLVEGYDDGTFKPGNSITRAEAATIIRRAWYVWYQ